VGADANANPKLGTSCFKVGFFQLHESFSIVHQVLDKKESSESLLLVNVFRASKSADHRGVKHPAGCTG
jgi:hypothetical protein